MSESDFWRDMATQFRTLPDPFGLLRANWVQEVGDNKPILWTISGLANQPHSTEFVSVARRAGKALHPPLGIDLADAWLNALKDASPAASTGSGHVNVNGVRAPFISGSINRLCQESAKLCNELEGNALESERAAEAAATVKAPIIRKRKRSRVSQQKKTNAVSIKRERKSLSNRYFDRFPEKVSVLDVCWAANQPYREWRRWINAELNQNRDAVRIKDGSKPDRAFRAILKSHKRPEQYRKEPRPPKWIGGPR